MPAVEFNPQEFIEIHKPRFDEFTSARLHHLFGVACELVDNTERSHVPYLPPARMTRKVILYALVCHLCELFLRGGGAVGNLTSASEGSVSMGFSAPANPNAAWYNQTQCGATAYQMMLPFMLGGRTYNGCFR